MLHSRLDYYAETRGVNAVSQFGFRKGRGTQDCLAVLATDLATTFDRKQTSIAVFLDISAAYDDVVIEILCNEMRAAEIPEKAIQTVYALFSKRIL